MSNSSLNGLASHSVVGEGGYPFAGNADSDPNRRIDEPVYRIGYEAIRNACVHSRATRLTVELAYANGLNLRVRDNGTGIDPEIVHSGKPGHFGLQTMRERAARIVGRFLVEGSGSGTLVTLPVPGGIIYRVAKK